MTIVNIREIESFDMTDNLLSRKASVHNQINYDESISSTSNGYPDKREFQGIWILLHSIYKCLDFRRPPVQVRPE